MNNKITFLIIVIAFVAVIGAVAIFVTNRDAEGNSDIHNGENDSDNSSNSSDDSEEFDIELEMRNFKYSDTLIEAAPGDVLKIKLVSEGGTHDFVIDQLDISSGEIFTGKSKIITIAIPDDFEPGDYQFYCSISDHRAMGMVGTLRIK